jgi:uncharacterized protein YcbK (DUF882 family)
MSHRLSFGAFVAVALLTPPAYAADATVPEGVRAVVAVRDLLAYARGEAGPSSALLDEARAFDTLVHDEAPDLAPPADAVVSYVGAAVSGGARPPAGELLDDVERLAAGTAAELLDQPAVPVTTAEATAWFQAVSSYVTNPATATGARAYDLMLTTVRIAGQVDYPDPDVSGGQQRIDALVSEAGDVGGYLAAQVTGAATGLVSDPAAVVSAADALSDVVVQQALDRVPPEGGAGSGFGSRTMRRGDDGPDVKELQIRVAGWYDNCAGVSCKTWFALDGTFGDMTVRAVKNFQKAYGLTADGVAGPKTNATLRAMEDADGSTVHFAYAEFAEKAGECSNSATTGTFKEGSVPEAQVKENVRRVMWRLETIRHKMADHYTMTVTSGFRSTAKQRCLHDRHPSTAAKPGTSQHEYGTARDGYLNKVSRGRERGLAKTSELHGIICYANGDTHNHVDIRMDNGAYSQGWSWPATDGKGRDKALGGGLCTGSEASPPSTGALPVAAGVVLDPWDAQAGGLDGTTTDLGLDPVGEVTGAADTVLPEDLLWIDDSEYVWDVPGGVCDC